MSLPISVVIPAKNAAETIADQLHALVGQHWPHGGEIIVADNGSDDLTAAIAQSFSSPELPVVVLSCPETPGPGYARNRGASHAKFDRLAFCDSDDVVGDRWVEELGRALDRADAVGGYIDLTRLNTEETARSRGSWNTTGLPLLEGQVPVLSSCNFAVSSEVFDQVGGFATDFTTNEDCELSIRLHRSGVETEFVPEAVVHYRMRPTLRGVFQQAFQWGTLDPEVLRRINPESPSLKPLGILRSWVWIARSPHLLFTKVGRYRYAHTFGKRLGFLVGTTVERFK